MLNLRPSLAAHLGGAIADTGGGGGDYVANAVNFDGRTCMRIASLTALDNALYSFSFWHKSGDSETVKDHDFWMTDPDSGQTSFSHLQCASPNPPRLYIYCANEAFSNILSAHNGNTIAAAPDGWHHYMGSVETNHASGAKIIKIYTDDVASQTGVSDSNSSFTMTQNGLAILLFGSKENGLYAYQVFGDVADFWLAPGISLLSGGDIPEATRRLFISAEGKPVDPSGFPSAPILLSGDATGFATNQGSGGSVAVIATRMLDGGGGAGAGPCALPLAVVGWAVTSVLDSTTATDVTADFETTISVADQIQQTGSADYSSDDIRITFTGGLTNASTSPSD